MRDCLLEQVTSETIPLVPVDPERLSAWLATRDQRTRRWVDAVGFQAAAETHCLVPDQAGSVMAVLVGVASWQRPLEALAHLPAALPAGPYRLECDWNSRDLEQASIGWGLGAYRFSRYREVEPVPARLILDPSCDARYVRGLIDAVFLVRDLVNTPAEDMTPGHLAAAIMEMAANQGATLAQLVGEELLEHNYPAIHAVGRAAANPPRLLELRWGADERPRLTLVGKGVCFDSGGLDLKPSEGMRLMKKDMGGAAHAIALAQLIMRTSLPVSLRVLIPAVENAVAGNAYRPGDVIRARNGTTIEIDNTDAEGRLVLADALVEAGAEPSDLIVDFATLTGAARVALGTDLPALFCNDDAVAGALMEAAEATGDPLWRLPLHRPYRKLIDSRVADIANSGSSRFAGAITAALFLEAFVPGHTPWVHLDLMAWNSSARPGHPEGGEAMGLRALFEFLRRRYPG